MTRPGWNSSDISAATAAEMEAAREDLTRWNAAIGAAQTAHPGDVAAQRAALDPLRPDAERASALIARESMRQTLLAKELRGVRFVEERREPGPLYEYHRDLFR